MSNWTHVAGIIRIDAFRFLKGEELDWDKIFGKECHFDSDKSIWNDYCNHPENYLPSGSEGTLQKLVWINPNINYTASYVVSIFGDLRDHDNPKEIIEWFKNVIRDNDLWVRNAVITAENEWHGTETWTYYEEDK